MTPFARPRMSGLTTWLDSAIGRNGDQDRPVGAQICEVGDAGIHRFDGFLAAAELCGDGRNTSTTATARGSWRVSSPGCTRLRVWLTPARPASAACYFLPIASACTFRIRSTSLGSGVLCFCMISVAPASAAASTISMLPPDVNTRIGICLV